jgi:hypothetical protein
MQNLEEEERAGKGAGEEAEPPLSLQQDERDDGKCERLCKGLKLITKLLQGCVGSSVHVVHLFLFNYFLAMLGIKPRTSHIFGTELHPSP